MTPRQTELARHALGLPNANAQSYRNRFICGTGHKDYADWQAMVAAGYAITGGADRRLGGAQPFMLTYLGARMALRAGERLDPEDFPAAEKLSEGA